MNKAPLIFLQVIAVASLFAADKPKVAEKPKIETFTEPAQAGPDFLDQGEYAILDQGKYANDWGGAQVIALSGGRFRLVIYKGGLPGAGWDKSAKQSADGKRDGDKVALSSTNPSSTNPSSTNPSSTNPSSTNPSSTNPFTHTIANGVLITTSSTGEQYVMKKIERKSPTMGAPPPAGALALFDGSNADAWKGGHIDDRRLLAAGPTSKRAFTNFTLHLEFLLPFKPAARGQERANSGVYMQDRYEIQVLDSFGLKGEDNECGGIYTQAKPLVNMCFPPLTWQTYDAEFEAAKFDESGKKIKNAVLTLKHNGVIIHDHLELKNVTPGGAFGSEKPIGGGIQLQGHGNPVFYRNIWVVEK